MSLNKVTLIGRLGQNPEVRYTPSGAAVANFSLATSKSWKDKSGAKQEKTEWHRIVVWNKLAETAGKYLEKGKQVYIEGEIQTRPWEDKDGIKRYTTEIVALSIQFLGSKSDGTGRQDPPPPGDEQAPPTGGGGQPPVDESDIPL